MDWPTRYHQSPTAPTIAYFKGLPLHLDKLWAVYLLVLEKAGQRPRIYIGSGTASETGVKTRVRGGISQRERGTSVGRTSFTQQVTFAGKFIRVERAEMQTELNFSNGFVHQYAASNNGQTASTMRALVSNQTSAQSAFDRVDRCAHILEEGNDGRVLALRTGKMVHLHLLNHYEKLRVVGLDASRALRELFQK